MTFEDWELDHNAKVDIILAKLDNKSDSEIIEYFEFDNMVKNEIDFCPLYSSNTKCHDTKYLNCYFCGCPYFRKSDDKPFYTKEDTKVMSICSIGAKDAKTFVQEGIQQCDCSNCDIPHKEAFVKKYFHGDGVLSSLERVREYQLKGRL